MSKLPKNVDDAFKLFTSYIPFGVEKLMKSTSEELKTFINAMNTLKNYSDKSIIEKVTLIYSSLINVLVLNYYYPKGRISNDEIIKQLKFLLALNITLNTNLMYKGKSFVYKNVLNEKKITSKNDIYVKILNSKK